HVHAQLIRPADVVDHRQAADHDLRSEPAERARGDVDGERRRSDVDGDGFLEHAMFIDRFDANRESPLPGTFLVPPAAAETNGSTFCALLTGLNHRIFTGRSPKLNPSSRSAAVRSLPHPLKEKAHAKVPSA